MPKQIPPSDRLIAYIDFLGFKETIRDKPNFCLTLLKQLKKVKKPAINVIEKNSSKANSRFSDKQVSIFSDLMVISYPLADKQIYFDLLCVELALILQPLLARGVTARGVITQGSLYHADDIIFGEALIEAYEIERKIVRYPRIIISDSLINKLKKYTYHTETSLDLFLSKDFDGFRYLDLFKALRVHLGDCTVCKDDHKPYLRKVRNKIISNIDNKNLSIDAISKWRWLAKKYDEHIMGQKIEDTEMIRV